MNNHNIRKKRLRKEWFLITVAAVALLAVLALTDLTRPLGNVMYDHFMRSQGFRASEDIVIIAIDDRSIQDLGGWPLQRHIYSQLLEQLTDNCCRPKAIGFDLLFLDATPHDAAFAKQLIKHKAIVPLAFKVQEQDQTIIEPVLPVAQISQSATLAHINLRFDTDGVIRAFDSNEKSWQHFALAMQAEKKVSDRNSGSVAHRFRMVDPGVGFPLISYTDAIKSTASRSLLKDKFVLVGVTAPSLGDRYPTLYSGKNNASTPGVAILASVLNASLNNSLISEANSWLVLATGVAALFIILQSLVFLQPKHALILAIGMVISAIFTSYSLLAFLDYWINPVPFIVVTLLLQPLWAWRRLEAIVDLVQDKAADLRQFQSSDRNQKPPAVSRDIVLQNAKILDHAVASVRSKLGFLAAIVDEMPDSILIFDATQKLLLCNRRIKKLFNRFEFKTGLSLIDIASELKIPADSLSNQGAKIGEKNTNLFQSTTSIGTLDFVIKMAKLDFPDGTNGHLLILIDVTELNRSQKQRDRALQFLSHDMRTPVASILSLTNRPDQDIDKSFRKITQHSKILLRMMDDFILTISSEAPKYNMQQVLLDNLLNDAIEEVTDLASSKRIKLVDCSDVSDIFLLANTRLLVRAFVNVLYNAIKFSPSECQIFIKTHTYGHNTHTTDAVTIIFTNSINNATEKNVDNAPMIGFGLGLNFVDNVIAKHNGSIERIIPTVGNVEIKITLPYERVPPLQHS